MRKCLFKLGEHKDAERGLLSRLMRGPKQCAERITAALQKAFALISGVFAAFMLMPLTGFAASAAEDSADDGTGIIIFLAVVLLVVICAVIAVVATISAKAAVIADEEDDDE